MPKRTRLEALSTSQIESPDIQEPNDEGEKNSKRHAAAQNGGGDSADDTRLQNLPYDLRALLRTLKPRFLPEREFNQQIQLLPHVLSLEILDGLEALPIFGSRGMQTKFFYLDTKKFMGRFKNATIERRFILIRRNFEIDATVGAQALLQSRDQQAFKRSFAALLRSARHIHFIANYSASLIQFITSQERVFLEAFGSLVQRAQARFKQLRNLHLSVRSKMDGSSEKYLLPFVTKVTILENLDKGVFDKLRMMPKLCSVEHVAGMPSRFDWSSVPLSVLRQVTVQNHLDASSWRYILQESKQLKFLSLDLSSNRVTAELADIQREIRSHAAAASLRVSLRLGRNTFMRELESMTQLTHLSFARRPVMYGDGDDEDDEATIALEKAVKIMNQRGQLLDLRISLFHRNKVTRKWLESIGIGHPNCALRTLELNGQPQFEPEVFVPILNCSRLENFSAVFGVHSTMLRDIKSILQERGLLLNIEFHAA